jgi:uncharacterized protein with FMN-binding domain
MKQASKTLRALTLGVAGTCSLVGSADLAQANTSYLGNAINYSFGIVQVQISVDATGAITQIDTPQYSRSGSNGSYSSYAIPILVKEALAAQSATIQGVSGASYISRGWITSLASAIAKVGSVTTAPATPTPAPVPTMKAAPSPQPTIMTQGGEEGEGGEHEGGEEHRRTPTMKPAPIATKPATPAPSASAPIILKPGTSVIQKSITCVKGATKKVIKGFAPKCPTGFTLKKP